MFISEGKDRLGGRGVTALCLGLEPARRHVQRDAVEEFDTEVVAWENSALRAAEVQKHLAGDSIDSRDAGRRRSQQ